MKTPTPAPAYACLFVILSETARANGYALTIHGSMSRDMDVVAIPWTTTAGDIDTLIKELCQVCLGYTVKQSPMVNKPHGRKAIQILLGNGNYIDLSIMPRTQ